MRYLRFLAGLAALLLALAAVGCRRQQDLFAPFRQGYVAELSGELYGVPFAAELATQAISGEGCAAATLTFYAPAVLADTVVTRAADGSITVRCGELTLTEVASFGAPLFALFPITGSATAVTLTEEGNTLVTGEGFTLTLLPDGTPIAVTNEQATARVVRWEAK